jgi:hypothetical protein
VRQFAGLGWFSPGVVFGDFNEDGFLDAIALGEGEDSPGLMLLNGRAGGWFDEPTALTPRVGSFAPTGSPRRI